jgi:hypothetical protein
LKRADKVVKAAQPEILGLVRSGAVITSPSIITVSFDESHGWSKRELDKAWVATPWFFLFWGTSSCTQLFSAR